MLLDIQGSWGAWLGEYPLWVSVMIITIHHQSLNHNDDNQAKETLYWGEYPLYFAACLGQEESYRLILARFVTLVDVINSIIYNTYINGNVSICLWLSMAMPERVSASIFSSFQFFRGADPDSLDTNGNNIRHMMVILNKVVSMLSTTR